MLCEHSIVWNNFIGIINMRRRWGITGQKKGLLPIRSYSSKTWCEQEVHMNSYGNSHLKNYEITFINLFLEDRGYILFMTIECSQSVHSIVGEMK